MMNLSAGKLAAEQLGDREGGARRGVVGRHQQHELFVQADERAVDGADGGGAAGAASRGAEQQADDLGPGPVAALGDGGEGAGVGAVEQPADHLAGELAAGEGDAGCS